MKRKTAVLPLLLSLLLLSCSQVTPVLYYAESYADIGIGTVVLRLDKATFQPTISASDIILEQAFSTLKLTEVRYQDTTHIALSLSGTCQSGVNYGYFGVTKDGMINGGRKTVMSNSVIVTENVFYKTNESRITKGLEDGTTSQAFTLGIGLLNGDSFILDHISTDTVYLESQNPSLYPLSVFTSFDAHLADNTVYLSFQGPVDQSLTGYQVRLLPETNAYQIGGVVA